MNNREKMIWAYRIVLGVAILTLFLPWAKGSGHASVSEIPGFSPGGSASVSAWISGLGTIWGWLVLIVAGGGVLVSFIGPNGLLKDKAKLGMAGVGVAVVLFSLIGLATASSQFGGSEQISNAYVSGSRSAEAGLGVYLTLIFGLAAAAVGFLADWGMAAE